MLAEELTLNPQKCEGNYDFEIPVRTSECFKLKFGEMAAEIVSKAIELIKKNHPNADCLQVFHYGNQKIWCFSTITKNEVFDDKYISFLLPEEYN